MRNWKRSSEGRQSFRLNTLTGVLTLALLCGASNVAQAAPVSPLGASFKLSDSPPERILSATVGVNNQGAGVALWQQQNEDGRYATYFRRFDRSGNVSSLQTHELATTYKAARLLKVLDNGEFAIEQRRGNTVRIMIRSATGEAARPLRKIRCKTIYCAVAMDDRGKLIVADTTISGMPRPIVQLRDRRGRVTRPWSVVDQPATGMSHKERVRIATNANSDFAIGWQVEAGRGDFLASRYVRFFQRAGHAKGRPFFVSSGDAWEIFEMAMDDGGNLAFAWSDLSSDPSRGDYKIVHKLYRKDGTLITEGIDGEGIMSPVGEPEGSGLVKIVMDDDGDYAQLHSLLGGNAPLSVTPSLDLTLSQHSSNTQLGTYSLSQFEVGYPDWQALPETFHPVLSGDIAMDGKGHLTALWLRKIGAADDPVGLFLQHFAGPLGE